jgi:hypothetical protein
VAQSLRDQVFSAADLFAKFAAQGPMLNQWLLGAQVAIAICDRISGWR